MNVLDRIEAPEVVASLVWWYERLCLRRSALLMPHVVASLPGRLLRGLGNAQMLVHVLTTHTTRSCFEVSLLQVDAPVASSASQT